MRDTGSPYTLRKFPQTLQLSFTTSLCEPGLKSVRICRTHPHSRQADSVKGTVAGGTTGQLQLETITSFSFTNAN